MKLQQLRYFLEVSRRNLNISEAAEVLFTSQPGISKQIKLLEDELGVSLFVRHGKRIVSLTPPGQAVVEIAERIFRDVQNIRNVGTEFAEQDSGRLTVATTHTQARYVLPQVVTAFLRRYPKVKLSLIPAAPMAIDQMVADGRVDLAVNSEVALQDANLRRVTAHPWHRCVLVPRGHAWAQMARPLVREDLAGVPLVTYADVADDSALQQVFAGTGLPWPETALASTDPDIIKTYVRAGIGVGLLADVAYDAEADGDLVCLPAGHMFYPAFTHIVVRQDTYLRGYAFEFMQLYLPQLSREQIEQRLYRPISEDFSI